MSNSRNSPLLKHSKFAKKSPEQNSDPDFAQIQKHIPKIQVNANIVYDGEYGINLAYCDLESSERLRNNEKRIFALRTDKIIALGVKNVEPDKQNFETKNIVPPQFKNYFDPNNRYGHPGLALPSGLGEPFYDGSVYYAGWIAQRKLGSNRDAHGDKLVNPDPNREKYIEIFLVSGRFMFPDKDEIKLSPEKTKLLETYIAKQLIKRWGPQPILFMDFKDKELPLYLQNKPHSAQKEARRYEPKDLFTKNELENISYKKELTPGSKKPR